MDKSTGSLSLSTIDVDDHAGSTKPTSLAMDIDSATKEQQYSDWNNWDFSNVNPKVKRNFKIIAFLLFTFLVVGLPILLGSCSDIVPFQSNAVIINSRGKIEDEAVGPGRIFRAAGFRIQEYPRFDRAVEYTASGNNPVSVRVKDGQIISLDISWQYHLEKSNLVSIYREHKGGFERTLSQVIFSTLRDTAAGYESQEFFDNRSQIEEQLRSSIVAEAELRQAEVTGFQVRSVDLPQALDDRLINIQLRQQDARAGTARLELDRINAEADRRVLELRTDRNRRKTEMEQQTTVQLQSIYQQRDRIREQTKQMITQIQQEAERNVSLYRKETELLLESIDLNKTVVLQETNRLVEAVRISASTNLSIYNQETANQRLAFDNDVALIQEQAKQNVSSILAATTREEQNFLADLTRQESAVAKEAQLLIEAARLNATQAVSQAFEGGLAGLSAQAYLAQEIGDAVMDQVDFLDLTTPTGFRLESLVNSSGQ
eukprot:TRINITY_DN5396_c0_g1_i1.p1 TRINITY_DN5396_c0_g1~~TRINITY_DN5396_c0_g1_i1.p1  ORF type:complete len:488 (+),score=153.48 TRINITY_DN5396_c0_g1_i1:86-1549(+)